MKKSLTKIDLIYWFTCFFTCVKLYTVSGYDLTKNAAISFLVFYFVIIFPFRFILKNDEKGNEQYFPKAKLPVTFYEAKMQFFVLSIAGILFFVGAYFLTEGALKSLSPFFTVIFFCFLVFSLFYPPAFITFNEQGFVYRRWSNTLKGSWNDIDSIQYEVKPGAIQDGFKSRTYCIVLKGDSGRTGYIDTSIIKIKGKYTLANQEESFLTLLKELTNKNPVPARSYIPKAKDIIKTSVIGLSIILIFGLCFSFVVWALLNDKIPQSWINKVFIYCKTDCK